MVSRRWNICVFAGRGLWLNYHSLFPLQAVDLRRPLPATETASRRSSPTTEFAKNLFRISLTRSLVVDNHHIVALSRVRFNQGPMELCLIRWDGLPKCSKDLQFQTYKFYESKIPRFQIIANDRNVRRHSSVSMDLRGKIPRKPKNSVSENPYLDLSIVVCVVLLFPSRLFFFSAPFGWVT